MRSTNLCRLCFLESEDLKSLYDANDLHNEMYVIVTNYFQPGILNMSIARHLRGICEECWRHLWDFHSFHKTIAEVQLSWLEAENDAIFTETESSTDSELSEVDHYQTMIEFETEALLTSTDDVVFTIDAAKEESSKDSEHNEIGNEVDHDQTMIEFETDLLTSTDDVVFTIDAVKEESLGDDEHNSEPENDSYQITDNYQETINLAEPKHAIMDVESELKEFDKEIPLMKSKYREITKYIKNYNERNIFNIIDNSGIRPDLKCIVCPETFSEFTLLREHFRQLHPPHEFYVLCCERKFNTLSKVEEHLLLHQNTNAFRCEICGHRNTTKSGLFQHKARVHPFTQKREYGCDKCNASFTTKSGLTLHKNTSHKSLCGNLFKRPLQLSKPKRLHREKNICSYCLKEFNNKSNLRRHLENIHGQERAARRSSLRPFTSQASGQYASNDSQQICDVESSEIDCQDFMKEVGTISSDLKEYSCSICESIFDSFVAMRRHFVVHKREDVFVCDFCPKTYMRGTTLKAHRIKNHLQVKDNIAMINDGLDDENDDAFVAANANEDNVNSEVSRGPSAASKETEVEHYIDDGKTDEAQSE